ncbi:hypothetical protein [Nonomuraea ceibae]|uniref:hypothetical protein n=1 Tax=Nonomuraea ceibae TaxID=1935170 RepID=UPI001C5FD03F|nr:hypothetical protein [Nonomuraea ceibae]
MSDRVVRLDDIVRLLPRRFVPSRDIDAVCEKLSTIRDREVIPAPFDSRQHPMISCSVTGFCVRTQERDYIGYPVDAPDLYIKVVFLHELCHWALNHRGQPMSRARLIQAAAPTLHLLAGETIQEILGRTGLDDDVEQEAESFAYRVAGLPLLGVNRIDPGVPEVLRNMRGAFTDPFGTLRRRRPA